MAEATTAATTTDTTAATTTTTAATTATTAPAPHWSGLTEAADIAYAENKGWKSPADVYKSYRGVETLVGRDPSTLVPLPRLDDPEGFRSVMQKLGLPESPDKYEFDKPADMALDEGYMGWARQTFHKIGLPAAQAKQLTAEHNAYIKGVMEQQAKDYDLSVASDKQALLKEWGGGHERMMNAAQTAAKSLGFTPEMIDSMEKTVGYASTMKFFAQLGSKLGEDKLVNQEGGPQRFGDALTPDEAKIQWEQSKLDPNFVKALNDNQHPGHKAAKEKQTRLFGIMYPNP